MGKPKDQQWNWHFFQVEAELSILRSFYRLADRSGLEVPISDRLRSSLVRDSDFLAMGGPNDRDVWLPPDLYEAAALAQHYGLPTRLLDWTYDLYVALYFAFRGAIGKEGNMQIWALNKESMSLHSSVSKARVKFITPHYSGNPNLNAQKGLFTHWPVDRPSMAESVKEMQAGRVSLTDRRPLDQLIYEAFDYELDETIFKSFILPCSEAIEGCKILDKLGYNSSRIFPGYGGVADQLLNAHMYGAPETSFFNYG